MPDTAARTARELHAKERQRQILQLRLSGAPFTTIAKHLGISDVAVAKNYNRALNAIIASDVGKERKAQTERCYREIYLLNTQKEKLKEQEGTSDQIARLSLVHFKWETRLASLLGLDAPREVKIESEDRMSIAQVREIMESARQRHPQDRHVIPDEIEPPLREIEPPLKLIEGPAEEPIEPDYINIESLRASAEAAKQKRLAEIEEFETLVAHGQAIPPQNHPSGRPWLENERRLPWHLVPGYEHLPKQPFTLVRRSNLIPERKIFMRGLD